jgi:hypothetical protein
MLGDVLENTAITTGTLSETIALLNTDFGELSALIRTCSHQIKMADSNIILRVHYLPFRNGRPMTGELLDHIRSYICNFALSRSEIRQTHEAVKGLTAQQTLIAYNKLRDTAADLFIKAQKSTNRNGECGELLLYLLIEWILDAPQIVAKMALKTNGQMPVHGSDGIHIKYDEASDRLIFLWGEAKLHAKIDDALASAIESISNTIKYSKQKDDISLVRRYFDLSGLLSSSREKILSYLNPLDEAYKNKIDVSACLIGFDFDGFTELSAVPADKVEAAFLESLTREISKAKGTLAAKLSKYGVTHHAMEVFFFPVESVSQLRVDFQNVIGWKS